MTTQFANASYQEIIDLHTESDSVSVVGVHTPCSDTPYHMLRGFWDQFRKFKYNGCSISLVPSAQLPVDPLQVSYDASEPTIDPRDMLNPILFHGCHGNDMGAILNSLYADPVSGSGQLFTSEQSDSVDHNHLIQNISYSPITDLYEQLYYRSLTDKTWLKAHPQRGFRKSGLHPMVYSVASTQQIAPNGNMTDLIDPSGITHNSSTGAAANSLHGVLGAAANSSSNDTVYLSGNFGRPTFSQSGAQSFFNDPKVHSLNFLTPRLQRLGWMDTRNTVGVASGISQEITSLTESGMNTALASLYKTANDKMTPTMTPKIFMGMIMLPPAYKVQQHFRLILNHSFSFAKFRGASMQYPSAGFVKEAYSVFNFSDSEASKKIDPPEPEPEPKDGVDNGDDGSKADL